MGNDSIIAFKTREQLRKYLGIFSPQFNDSRWKMEFLGQMLFGIQASRDTLMSEIARSLQEDILAKKTQERLERHLATEGMDSKVHGSILCDAAPGIHDDTLIIVDPMDVQKGYAEKMPYLAKVWDDADLHLVENARSLRLPGIAVGAALSAIYSDFDFLDMLHMPLFYNGAQYLTNGPVSKEPTFLIGCTLF